MKKILLLFTSIFLFGCSKKNVYLQVDNYEQKLNCSKENILRKQIMTIDYDKINYQLSFYEASLRDSLQDFSYSTVNTFNKNSYTFNYTSGESKQNQIVYLTFFNDGRVEYYAPFFEKNLKYPGGSITKSPKYWMKGFIIDEPVNYINKKIVTQNEKVTESDLSKKFTIFLTGPTKKKYLDKIENKKANIIQYEADGKLNRANKIRIKINSIEKKRLKSIYLSMAIDKSANKGIYISQAFIQKQIESNSFSHIQINPQRAFNLGTLSQNDPRSSKLYFQPYEINK